MKLKNDDGIRCVIIGSMLLVLIISGGIWYLSQRQYQPEPLPRALTELLAGTEKPVVLPWDEERAFIYKDGSVLRLTNDSPKDGSAVRCRVEVLTMQHDSKKEYILTPILRLEAEAARDETGEILPGHFALVPSAGNPLLIEDVKVSPKPSWMPKTLMSEGSSKGTMETLPDENGVLCTLEAPWFSDNLRCAELRLQLKMTICDNSSSTLIIDIIKNEYDDKI